MPSTARVLLDFLARPERHRYGAARSQRADLYAPDGEGPFPVAALLHGGYWRAKYGKRTLKPMAADLVRRGCAVWNIEYRRMGRGLGGGWPATFDDVGAAIDLLAELDDPRLDLGSLTAIGHSAGGQLALWAAARQDPAVPIQRVAALAPVCDMARAGEPVHELLGGTPEEVPERYAATDPMQLLPIGVPTLIVHGADDTTVSVKRSRTYAEAARAAGDPVELVEPPSAPHRSHADPRTDAWRVTADWVTAGAYSPLAGTIPD